MNTKLADLLLELSRLYDILDEPFRSRAYLRASVIVRSHTVPLNVSTVDAFLANPPEGIGKRIAALIREYVATGILADIDRLKSNDRVSAHEALGKILGVGPVTIRAWLQKGVGSIATLRQEAAKGNITLTGAQSVGLRYYEDLTTRIPRAEVEHIGSGLCDRLRDLAGGGFQCEIVGSYRRGADTSGDIDILVCTKEHDPRLFDYMMIALGADKNFVHLLIKGPERISFLYRGPRDVTPDNTSINASGTEQTTNTPDAPVTTPIAAGRVRQVDILYIRREAWAAALLYFTGSWTHNESMRGWAKARGMRLNQNGLWTAAKPPVIIPTPSERDIYARLGLRWMEPSEREGQVVPM